eukprot:12537076-Alexandrium_andersonii.AAC.1
MAFTSSRGKCAGSGTSVKGARSWPPAPCTGIAGASMPTPGTASCWPRSGRCKPAPAGPSKS